MSINWQPHQYGPSLGHPPPGARCLTPRCIEFVRSLPPMILREWCIEASGVAMEENPLAAVLEHPRAIRGWDFDRDQPVLPWHFNDPKWAKLVRLRELKASDEIIDVALDVPPRNDADVPSLQDHDFCPTDLCRHKLGGPDDEIPSDEDDFLKPVEEGEEALSRPYSLWLAEAQKRAEIQPPTCPVCEQALSDATAHPSGSKCRPLPSLHDYLLAQIPTFEDEAVGPKYLAPFLSSLRSYFAMFPQRFDNRTQKGREQRLVFMMTKVGGVAHGVLSDLLNAYDRKEKNYWQVMSAFQDYFTVY